MSSNPDLHFLPRAFGTNGFLSEVPPFVHKSLFANLFHCQVATFARGKTFLLPRGEDASGRGVMRRWRPRRVPTPSSQWTPFWRLDKMIPSNWKGNFDNSIQVSCQCFGLEGLGFGGLF